MNGSQLVCTSQKTHRGGLGLGGSVHEEAHPCLLCFIQPSFKIIDAVFEALKQWHQLAALMPLPLTVSCSDWFYLSGTGSSR